MSNSVLYHMFGAMGVQYKKADFLAARQYSMAHLLHLRFEK